MLSGPVRGKIARWSILACLLLLTSSAHSPNSKLSDLRFAFIDSTSEAARTALEKHIDDLDGIIGEWLDVNSVGKISEVQDPDQDDASPSATLEFVRAHRALTILALLSDDPGDSRAFAHLGNPAFRYRMEQQVLDYVHRFNFDGILINFDDPRGADEIGLLQLLRELHAALSPLGKKIGVVLPGNWPVDYKAIGSLSDLVVIELYDEGRSEPGPLSPDPWWRRVIADRVQSIPSDKLIFSIASIGRDWTLVAPDGESEPAPFGSLMLAAASEHAAIEFDAPSGNPHFSYTGKDGVLHEVWFLDAATVFNQLRSIVHERPKGVALWELGAEDESLWSVFGEFGSRTDFDTAGLSNIRSDYVLTRVGQGEAYRFMNRARVGRRTVERNESGKIIDETYEVLPRPWEVQLSGVLPGSVILTFDDGPDAEYTEKILDILKREGVNATFFVVGLQAISHPRTVRRIVAEGNEIGNHTFTHPDLTKLPDFLVRLEINATQRLLQVLTGKSAVLIRPPYASDTMADTIKEAHVLEIASGLGYTAIGANLNPEDWRGISAQEIVSRVLRKVQDNRGSVIELHDAGGDRSQTIAALPILIEALRSRGFKFVPASQLLGAGEPATAGSNDTWLPIAKVGIEGMTLENWGFLSLFWTCIILSTVRFVLLLTSALHGRRAPELPSGYEPQVSVLIAAYNEETVIVRTIEFILHSNYGSLTEVIVVDDGSTDSTAAVVETAFQNEPRVRLFRTPNRGKAEALNFAISQMTTEIAVMIDADTCLDSLAIRELSRHFSDPKIGAVAGNAKVGNRINTLTKLQALEYITSQNLERAGLANLNAITVVPGAIGAWRREALLKAEGFTTATIAEDCDLTFSLHRLGYQIVHDMNAIAWTEAPETWGAFARQRFRWIFGTLQATYRHSDALFKSKCDAFTLVTLPSVILFSVVLPLISPILDVTLLFAVCSALINAFMHPQAYSLQPTIWIVGSYVFIFVVDLFTALLAFAFEPSEQKSLMAYLPVQRFCYRQVMYVIIIRALLACLRGDAQSWNKLKRVGSVTFESVAEARK